MEGVEEPLFYKVKFGSSKIFLINFKLIITMQWISSLQVGKIYAISYVNTFFLTQKDLEVIKRMKDLSKVILREAWAPAQVIHRPYLGHLGLASGNDVTVYDLCKIQFRVY